MRIKKISLLLVTAVLTLGLAGCMPKGKVKLPEGDVKIAKQQIQGVLDFMLQSAEYGPDKSIIASMLLPEDAAYDLILSREQYKDGNLVETKEITTYTTETIAKDNMIHIVINSGKISEDESLKTIYSVAEVDAEKTAKKEQPVYKVAKVKEVALNYDLKSDVAQVGKNLDEEVVLTGYVKFKDADTEKVAINLDTYKEEVSKYAEVNIVKVKVTKK
ncbi:hypothetical protein [Clostridium gasigenes]|uniref:Lipoprotein n=1 Tax=Clostridium gasigenes TaxID=94869 RepID=A0A7X0VRG9_9CLOT|nr:hypothetical protein [Clostridium gasigenes]MBB6713566.1 hypothetical protein [Clostridium gasigenes]